MPRPLRIFLADDDEDGQYFFTEALRSIDESIQCITTWNGADAIRNLNAMTLLPDIIFLDMNMPRMNGLECLAAIKKGEHLNKIPVVIISTANSEQNIIAGFKLGAAGFVKKSDSLEDLKDFLRITIQSISEA